MDKNILANIKPLTNATGSQHLSWDRIDNTQCLTTVYDHRKFIICKYTFQDTNTSVISFNYLDDDNSVIGELNECPQADPEYNELNRLYEVATESAVHFA
jgi:hypothetical protein